MSTLRACDNAALRVKGLFYEADRGHSQLDTMIDYYTALSLELTYLR